MMTTQQLRDFLGVGEDVELESFRAGALEELRRATGVDWEKAQSKALAGEALKIIVYLNYYGLRSGQSTEQLERAKNRIITMLQYGKEATAQGTTGEAGSNGI